VCVMVTTSRLIAAISHCLPALPVCRSRRNCASRKSRKNSYSTENNMDGNAFLTEDAAPAVRAGPREIQEIQVLLSRPFF
jgi:hypothetical protein